MMNCEVDFYYEVGVDVYTRDLNDRSYDSDMKVAQLWPSLILCSLKLVV
jgi:hypothetical protein